MADQPPRASRRRLDEAEQWPPTTLPLRRAVPPPATVKHQPLRPVEKPNGRTIYLPDSYNEHSVVQLCAPRDSDTTDRSLVHRAAAADRAAVAARGGAASSTFDASGFDEGLALQKDIFYRSPFLTCKQCTYGCLVIRNLCHVTLPPPP